MFPSVRVSPVDLIIVVSKNIEVTKRELVLVGSKYLCYYNIVRTTDHPPTSSTLEVRALLRPCRIGTRSSISYIKSCMNRGAYSSLVE